MTMAGTTQPPSSDHINPSTETASVRFGNLNTKETIWFLQECNPTQLRQIIHSTPATLRKEFPLDATQHHLLAEVFRLRQLENHSKAHQEKTAELQKISGTPPQELMDPANNRAQELTSLMNLAVRVDS